MFLYTVVTLELYYQYTILLWRILLFTMLVNRHGEKTVQLLFHMHVYVPFYPRPPLVKKKRKKRIREGGMASNNIPPFWVRKLGKVGKNRENKRKIGKIWIKSGRRRKKLGKEKYKNKIGKRKKNQEINLDWVIIKPWSYLFIFVPS